jgi:hypothetical protein
LRSRVSGRSPLPASRAAQTGGKRPFRPFSGLM